MLTTLLRSGICGVKFTTTYCRFGLKISVSKTEIMVKDADNYAPLHIGLADRDLK